MNNFYDYDNHLWYNKINIINNTKEYNIMVLLLLNIKNYY